MNIELADQTTTQPDNKTIEALANELLKLFVTRTDCYAVQSPDGAYYPVRESVTLNVIEAHLRGQQTIGIYILNEENRVHFLALDIDLNKDQSERFEELQTGLQETALRVAEATQELGLDCLLEFSGRKGYHILVLFEEPVPAALAKRLGQHIVEKINAIPAEQHIEIFPKQDTIDPGKGFGNLIKLPLGLHRKSGKRSQIVDPASFEAVDPMAAFATVRKVTSSELEALVDVAVGVESKGTSGTGLQLEQDGIEKMVEHCPIIRKFEEDPDGWGYDPWLGIASNYRVFKGGWARFVSLCVKEPARFDQQKLDDLHDDLALNWKGPQTYETFRSQGMKFDLPANAPKSPAGWGSWNDPVSSSIVERDGCYGKLGKEGVFCMLTPFTMHAKYLLDLPDGDVASCNIKHVSGREWDEVLVENTDWHTRGKFMKALKHSECTFHGSDLDVIDLCQHVIAKVQVRKQGTRTIGLVDDTWVIRDCNLTAAGVLEPMKITPYDRSSDSLHARVQYRHLEESEYRTLVQTFLDNILGANIPEVMLPILGWFFSVPLKPRFMDKIGSFPILFCYGTQGGGKTSLLEMLLSLQGYNDPTVSSCTMKEFPLLKLASSTNAVPIVLDEFKPYDMKNGQVMTMSRFIRKSYRGEIEDKGNADQSVTHYQLSAPLVICGEAKLKEAAVMERLLVAGFTDAIKRDVAYQTAFRALKGLDLQGFMDRYVPFCLAADFDQQLVNAELATKKALNGTEVAPRIFNNLVALTFGLSLMQDFAKSWGVNLNGKIDLVAALANQVEEITGSGHGQVKQGVDRFLEQLARMVEKGLAEKEVDFTFTKMKNNIPGKKIDTTKKYLAVQLSGAVQTFISNIGRIGYVGEILDADSYTKQLKTCDYIVKIDHQKHFKPFGGPAKGINKKCVVIDLEKAEAAGLDISGFYSIVQSCNSDEPEDDKTASGEKNPEPEEKVTEELPF